MIQAIKCFFGFHQWSKPMRYQLWINIGPGSRMDPFGFHEMHLCKSCRKQKERRVLNK